MAKPPFLVVVTGLQAEARIASPTLGRALISGGDTMQLESELHGALSEGAGAVLSFGLAAGLEPGRSPGTLIVPGEIICGSARYRADTDWSERLRSALGGADSHPLIGVDAPLSRSADKLRLHEMSGAVAADMESHIAARLALPAGRPFAALRVICDPAGCDLPPSAVTGMKRDGRVDLAAVLLSLLRDPRQVAGLLRVAADARIAMSELKRCRHTLGPEFAWQAAS